MKNYNMGRWGGLDRQWVHKQLQSSSSSSSSHLYSQLSTCDTITKTTDKTRSEQDFNVCSLPVPVQISQLQGKHISFFYKSCSWVGIELDLQCHFLHQFQVRQAFNFYRYHWMHWPRIQLRSAAWEADILTINMHFKNLTVCVWKGGKSSVLKLTS